MASSQSQDIASIQTKPSGKQPQTSFQALKTTIVSSAHATHDTYSGFIAPLLPFLIDRMSLLKSEAALFLLFYQGMSILQPLIGHIGDRTNLRKYALLSPSITGILLSLLSIAPNLPFGLLLCIVAGLSSAVMHATLPVIVTHLSGDNLGKGMSIWMVGGTAGVMIGPLLITLLITKASINAIPFLMIPGILMSIILSILLRNMPFHPSNNHGESARIPIRNLAAVMLPIMGFVVMRALVRAAPGSFLPIFLTESGSSLWFSGISLSVLQGFGIIGTILGGYLNDRHGFRMVMLISAIISSIALFAFSFSNGILQIISLGFLGIAIAMFLPVGMAVIQLSFPENRSLANGIYLALLFAINALASVAAGFLYDHVGGQNTFIISAGIGLLAIPFIYLMPYDKKRTESC